VQGSWGRRHLRRTISGRAKARASSDLSSSRATGRCPKHDATREAALPLASTTAAEQPDRRLLQQVAFGAGSCLVRTERTRLSGDKCHSLRNEIESAPLTKSTYPRSKILAQGRDCRAISSMGVTVTARAQRVDTIRAVSKGLALSARILAGRAKVIDRQLRGCSLIGDIARRAGASCRAADGARERSAGEIRPEQHERCRDVRRELLEGGGDGDSPDGRVSSQRKVLP
jgi:hypothetical protein